MFCYTFHIGQNTVTVDSGKKTREEALADINDYLDHAHPAQPPAKLRQIETVAARDAFVALKHRHTKKTLTA